MRTIAQIMMAISGIALFLAALMGLNILKVALLNVSGTGFVALSAACSLFAIGLHLIKPFGKGETGA